MVGYSVQQLETFILSNKCPCCSLLLRDPVQLIDCAHRICQSCANDQPGNLITCPDCHQTTPRNQLKLDRGCKNDMKTLLISCTLCDWSGVLKTFQNHLDQTHPKPICSLCGETFPSVHDLNQHVLMTCLQVTMDCSLKRFGCEEKVLRANLLQHYLTERHQMALIEFLVQRSSRSSSFRTDHLPVTHLATTADSIDHMKKVNENLDILSALLATLNSDDQRLKNECMEEQNTHKEIVQDLPNLKKSVEEQAIFTEGLGGEAKDLSR